MFDILKPKAVAEALRAIRGNKHEVTDAGVVIPSMKVRLGGVFQTSVNGGAWEADSNLVVTEGINYILGASLGAATAQPTFYIALFSGNVTPASTWTAATVVAGATEFTNYNEANRVVWNESAPTAGAVNNDASPAVFTISTGGGTVRGAFLISSAAKSATTGVLICAARFGTDKVMAAAEELRVKYGIAGTSV